MKSVKRQVAGRRSGMRTSFFTGNKKGQEENPPAPASCSSMDELPSAKVNLNLPSAMADVNVQKEFLTEINKEGRTVFDPALKPGSSKELRFNEVI
jgi:hypothetical protein